MKQIIISLIMLIGLSFIASAITGGETYTLFEGECDRLIVNVTIDPTQDEGEYVIEPNCVETSFIDNTKLFNCNCTDNHTMLNITSAINSVGDYNIMIDIYKYTELVTSVPIEYNITNPTMQNITQSIPLPNDMVIKRVIPPGETLTYIETIEKYIIVPDYNVTFESVTTDNENINIIATSSGYKCFDIYSPIGIPYSVSVNSSPVSFTFNVSTNVVHFCTTFSTRSISLSWIFPVEEEQQSSGGGGGSGGGGSVVRNTFKSGERTQRLVYGSVMYIEFEDKRHNIMINRVYSDRITLKIRGSLYTLDLSIGETGVVDFNEDGVDDMSVKLVSIERIGGTFLFNMLSQPVEEVVDVVESVEEPVDEVIDVEQPVEEVDSTLIPEEDKKVNGFYIFGILAVITIIICLGLWVTRNKKTDDEKSENTE